MEDYRLPAPPDEPLPAPPDEPLPAPPDELPSLIEETERQSKRISNDLAKIDKEMALALLKKKNKGELARITSKMKDVQHEQAINEEQLKRLQRLIASRKSHKWFSTDEAVRKQQAEAATVMQCRVRQRKAQREAQRKADRHLADMEAERIASIKRAARRRAAEAAGRPSCVCTRARLGSY